MADLQNVPTGGRVKTLLKAEPLLRAFSRQKPLWRSHELAAHLEWDRATTHRFLHTLADCGMLERGDDETFGIGPAMIQLSGAYTSTTPARRLVVDEVDAIVRETGLTTQVGLLDAAAVVIVESREGTLGLAAASTIGARLPIHGTAMGIAMLALFSDEEVAASFPRRLAEHGAGTPTSREGLLAEVATARAEGLARGESAIVQGVAAVAVALPPGTYATMPAALAVSGPLRSTGLFDYAKAEEKLRAVRDEVVRLSAPDQPVLPAKLMSFVT
jgi:DNA-binding IclR family transcriptional regulator